MNESTISEYVGRLTVVRCWCGIQHAVPESMVAEQIKRRDMNQKQLAVFCPLGHETNATNLTLSGPQNRG